MTNPPMGWVGTYTTLPMGWVPLYPWGGWTHTTTGVGSQFKCNHCREGTPSLFLIILSSWKKNIKVFRISHIFYIEI